MRTDFETLQVTVANGIADIVLNRPDQRNAMSHQMEDEIDLALDEAEVDKAILAVTVRGNGKIFSAGHDLKEEFFGKKFSSVPDPDLVPSRAPTFNRAWYFRKPLIAGVHGYLGPAAIGLVACADFVIAAEGTRFSLEVFKGAPPTWRWLPLYLYFPPRVMEKLFLMGGWLDAAEAHQFQFVQRVVPLDQLEAETRRWAKNCANVPRERFQRGKWEIRRVYEIMGTSWFLQLEPWLRKTPEGGEESPFSKTLREQGMAAAVAERDSMFDDDVLRV
jgi:enoyl-CoA hydratase/carnithine racemase